MNFEIDGIVERYDSLVLTFGQTWKENLLDCSDKDG